jgi:multiple sugar transport system substrate-binding protein
LRWRARRRRLAPGARAADKSATSAARKLLHQNLRRIHAEDLAPAYEKETGVKVVYELTSVGSLPTRISTVSETGSGADVTMIFLLYPFLFDEKLMDVGDIAEEIGKKQGGWYDAAKKPASSMANGRRSRTAISAS